MLTLNTDCNSSSEQKEKGKHQRKTFFFLLTIKKREFKSLIVSLLETGQKNTLPKLKSKVTEKQIVDVTAQLR